MEAYWNVHVNVQRGQRGGEVASIVDVAARAGVSRQTVSNVLNAPDRVSPQTRRRVEEAISQLHYRPNRSAQNLRSQRSRLLGVDLAPMGPHEVAPVLDRFVHALSEEAARHGYHVLLFPRAGDGGATHLGLYETRTVDGFVLVDTERDDPRAAALVGEDVPFVTFGRTGATSAHDVVDVDGFAGGRAVASQLVASGCRRPAYVAWPEGSLAGDDRLAGFLAGCEDAGIDPGSVPVLRRLNRVEDGVDAALSLVEAAERPDAIATVSDLIAVGVIRGLRSLGLRAGDEIRVVGFDDAPLSAHLDPPLTTVRQPLGEVARRVVERFLARLSDPDSPVVTQLLEPYLVVRRT
jgi:DNA-binding LacI/PurR family transcriptional regulator